jgi:SAM-dependent methyltransferase
VPAKIQGFELNTPAQAFAGVAEVYERARPSYPAEAVAWIVERCGLGPGAVVCDVAAGTGKFTRLLVPTGARVIAVEPVPEMRGQLEAAVAGVVALAGAAESLPLDDASVDCITVAQAFHWFDYGRALPELGRAIRPGGRLALIWNVRDDRDPLAAAVEEVIAPFVPPEQGVERPWREPLEAFAAFGEIEHRGFPFEQLLDADGLVERIASISWIARLDDDTRRGVLERIRKLGNARGAPFSFPYITETFVCERLPQERRERR